MAVEVQALLVHLVVAPFSDQIVVPAEVLLLVPAGTEGLQVPVFQVAGLVVDRNLAHPVVAPFSDQIVVPAEALLLVLAETEVLQVVLREAVLVVGRIQVHPVGDPVVVPLGAQSLVHREDQAGVVAVHQVEPAGVVVPPDN